IGEDGGLQQRGDRRPARLRPAHRRAQVAAHPLHLGKRGPAVTEQPSSERQTLTPSLAARVDEACDRFEQEWEAGPRPRIEDYLGRAAEGERPALLRELLVLEVELRRRQGEDPRPEEYRARFPALDVEWVARVIAAPTAPGTPRPTGKQLPLAGQVRQLRCPHCHNPIQLV